MRIKIPRFDPISDPEKDKLGFKNAAIRLQTILSNIETPNTFGIYGIWGSGKTSLMKLTQRLIDESRESNIATIWFDPWKYEYEKDVPIVYPLLFQIEKALKDPSLTSFLKDSGKFLGTVGLSTASTAIKILSGGTIDQKLKDISDDIDVASSVFYSKYETWAANLDNFQDEFEKKLTNALKAKKLEKLYIFVDDMDRCLQENAVHLLEIMKNYLNVKNTLFIVGMDRRVIIDHINNKYNSDSYGEEYLYKIIPSSINLPSKNPLDIVSNILQTLEERDILTDEEISLIGSHLEHFCSNNRRLINIIFHKFLLVLSYVDLDKLLGELHSIYPQEFTTKEQCRMALFRWCLVQELFPKLFNKFEWPTEFVHILTSAPGAFGDAGESVKQIGLGWKMTNGSNNRLTPRLETNSASILNQYINDGLFKDI